MLDEHNTRLPPPANWQDFEGLCLDLLGEIYGTDLVQRYGRPGQGQSGIDIIIGPDPKNDWIGVQCKKKEVYPEKCLRESEVQREVTNATAFKPTISQYIIATSAPRDKKIQDLAMEITERHRGEGKFSVRIWSWDDIEELLRKTPAVLKRWYRPYQISDIVGTIETKVTSEHEETRTVIEAGFRQQREFLLSGIDLSVSSAEYHEDLDLIQKELDEHRPSTALRLLSRFSDMKWSRVSDDIKYRIVTLQGTAEIRLNNIESGGRKLIKALQYKPNEDKAMLNAALGYILIGKADLAENLALKVIERNNFSPVAYARLIQARGQKEPIEPIISQIPESLLHSPDVAVALGQHYYFQRDYRGAVRWLEIARENYENNSVTIRTLLASANYHAVQDDPQSLQGLQISEGNRTLLMDAIRLFDEVLTEISEDNDLIRKTFIVSLIERAHVNRMLGREDRAAADIDRAYQLDQTDPEILYIKGWYAFRREEYVQAEKYFQQVLWTERFSPTALELFFECLRRQHRFDEAIKLIQSYQGRGLTQEQEETLASSLLKLYVTKGKDCYKEAEELAKKRLQEDEGSIQKHLDLIKVLHQIGKTPDAVAHLDIVKELFSDALSPQQQLEIADICYHLNQFDVTVAIYQKFIDPTQDTVYTHRFIDACYFGGYHEHALELCRKLHSVHAPLNHSANIELAIYLEIGDLSEAERLCEAFLEKFPDDYDMRVTLAMVYFRDGDVASVESLLSLPYEFEALSYFSGAKLVRLYYYHNRFYEALDLAYRLLKKYFKLPEAHWDYIALFLDLGDERRGFSDLEVVKLGSSVCYEDQSGKAYVVMIDSDTQEGHPTLDPSEPLAQLLLGKPVGAEISLHGEQDPLFDEHLVIKSIKSKYVHAFQDSAENFAHRFPGNKGGPRRFPMRHDAEGRINPEDIERLKQAVSRNVDWANPAFEIYKQRKLPIEALANHLKSNLFSVCSLLVQSPDMGIYYTPNPHGSHLTALPDLDDGTVLVLDPVAIATIHSLQMGGLLKERYGKLGIAQSTIDLIGWAVLEYSGIHGRAHSTLTITNGSLAMLDVPEEAIRKDKESLEALLKWVRTNCAVIPCYRSLKYDYSKKQQYNSLLGAASIDSILLATLPNHILYSDDALIHLIGRQDFGVSSTTSTPSVLLDCLNAGVLTQEQHSVYISHLIRWHYHPIPVDAELLLDSAERSLWDLNSPFIDLIEAMGFRGQTGDPEVIGIALKFTELLWAEDIDEWYRNVLFLKLITMIAPSTNAGPFVHFYANVISMRPTLTESAKTEVFENLSLWCSLFQERLRDDENSMIDQNNPSAVQ